MGMVHVAILDCSRIYHAKIIEYTPSGFLERVSRCFLNLSGQRISSNQESGRSLALAT